MTLTAPHASDDAPILKRKVITLYNILLLCVVGLGSMSYGYTASIIGTTLGQPSFIAYFELDTRPNGTDLTAAMNGIFQAGGVIGTLSLSWIADKWGRKMALAVSSILGVISGAVLAGSTHIAEFLVFRFIAGASAFMVLAAVPLWMGEVVPSSFRGGLVDIHAVFLLMGYMVQGWVGFGFYFWTTGGENTWRPPLALQCVWPLLLLIGLYWVPESPRWLILQDRIEEATAILTRLHADPSDPEHTFARAELYQIQRQIVIDRTLGASWMDMLKKPSNRKRCLYACGTTAIVSTSGVLVINNYGPTLYRNLGFSPVKQLLYPAAWLTLALGINIMAIWTIDLFPRNKYMAFGMAGCMMTLIIEAALVAEFGESDNEAALQAAVAMFFIFQLFYGLCLDGTQFAYLAELFPNHLRSKGVCLGVATISLSNLIWLQAAPTAFENIGWKYYLLFIICGSLGGATMWFLFPDTNGLPLEEIAALFGDEKDVAVYQREIDVANGGVVGDGHSDHKVEVARIEDEK